MVPVCAELSPESDSEQAEPDHQGNGDRRVRTISLLVAFGATLVLSRDSNILRRADKGLGGGAGACNTDRIRGILIRAGS